MNFDVTVVIIAVAFVGGVVLTLKLMGRRPINVNVNAHAEAHGGHATSVPSSSAAPTSGAGIVGIIKFVAIAIILALGLVSVIGLISKVGTPVVNVPAQVPPVVNVPAQPPPVINVPQAAPPIVNVPKADPPTINVSPRIPVTTVPSAVETIALVTAIAALIIVIVTCILALRIMRRRDRETIRSNPAQYQYPVEYVRTPYGWSPKPVEPTDSIPAEQVAPGLFTQRPK